MLGGPCVQFVKSYLKRDSNPTTDTPSESKDREAARAHFRSTRTYRQGGDGGESCGSFRIKHRSKEKLQMSLGGAFNG